MNIEINNRNNGYDLYDIINLIWKNKFKMFIVPITISLITFIFYNGSEEIFNYENEIFIDNYKIAQIEKEIGFGSITNLEKKISKSCRNKYKFFSENANNVNLDILKQLTNGKQLKCDHNKQDERFTIVLQNVLLSENLLKEEIEEFPFIFFDFINNSVKSDIIKEIRNRKETEILHNRRRLEELKNNVKIEKSEIENQYINTLKELNLHLEIARTNNIISPQEDAPGFSSNFARGFYNTEQLYKNGVTSLSLFIESIEDRYNKELLESLTLQSMERDIEYIEVSLNSTLGVDFININAENDFFEVLTFEKDNEYQTTFSKLNFNFLITLFLSFGIILISVILSEGYKSRQSMPKN